MVPVAIVPHASVLHSPDQATLLLVAQAMYRLCPASSRYGIALNCLPAAVIALPANKRAYPAARAQHATEPQDLAGLRRAG